MTKEYVDPFDNGIDFDDCVWVVQQAHGESWEVVRAFEECPPARSVAEGIVGNRSAAQANSDTIIYGDGTGNTTVMVRKFPRAFVKIPVEK